ncbi:hypothetical protein PC123_g25371 [Phytophthora cactorum]|nr:hypothetical protein PC123_g25371 [Phytophthora cactorum]
MQEKLHLQHKRTFDYLLAVRVTREESFVKGVMEQRASGGDQGSAILASKGHSAGLA